MWVDKNRDKAPKICWCQSLDSSKCHNRSEDHRFWELGIIKDTCPQKKQCFRKVSSSKEGDLISLEPMQPYQVGTRPGVSPVLFQLIHSPLSLLQP